MADEFKVNVDLPDNLRAWLQAQDIEQLVSAPVPFGLNAVLEAGQRWENGEPVRLSALPAVLAGVKREISTFSSMPDGEQHATFAPLLEIWKAPGFSVFFERLTIELSRVAQAKAEADKDAVLLTRWLGELSTTSRAAAVQIFAVVAKYNVERFSRAEKSASLLAPIEGLPPLPGEDCSTYELDCFLEREATAGLRTFKGIAEWDYKHYLRFLLECIDAAGHEAFQSGSLGSMARRCEQLIASHTPEYSALVSTDIHKLRNFVAHEDYSFDFEHYYVVLGKGTRRQTLSLDELAGKVRRLRTQVSIGGSWQLALESIVLAYYVEHLLPPIVEAIRGAEAAPGT